MLVEVKDLRIGDEIIVPSNSNLRYLKLLRQPILKKGAKVNWKTQCPVYKPVMCSTRRDVKTYTYPGSNKAYTYNEWICTPEEHNVQRYENLNYRKIWLVKRERE